MTTIPGSDSRLLKRIISIFKPHLWQVIVACGAIIFATLLALVEPILIREIFDHVIEKKDLDRLILYAGLLFVVPILAHVIDLGRSILTIKLGQHIVNTLRDKIYARLQRMSMRFYLSTRIGELHTRLTNDVNGVQTLVVNAVPSGLSMILTVIGSFSAMLYISPALTILSITIMPVVIFVTYRVGNMQRRIHKEHQTTLSRLSSVIADTLSINGILHVKAFGRQKHATDKFSYENEYLGKLEIRRWITRRVGMQIVGVIFATMPAAFYLLAGWQMIQGESLLGAQMTVGSLIAFTALQARFFAPIAQLFALQTEIQSGLALFERIFEYIDLPIDMVESTRAVRLAPLDVRGNVTFRNVTFTYTPLTSSGPPDDTSQGGHGMSHTALKDVSLDIPAGKVIAFVGPSGAGKSTLAYLLMRLYDVDHGSITIDGYNVREIEPTSLARLIGVVMQETYLLPTTVRENLLYARLEATEAEMIAAAKAAFIHDRIMELGKGYDTVLGEQGYTLSGGERQRLAIARLLLKDPPILLLDEPTSALDSQSERLVQAGIKRSMKGRTTLIIAHRLSTIAAADLIVVLKQGEIIEKGTHSQLLAKGGLYTELHQQQLQPND